MVMQRVVKPKTQQGRRALELREPKIVENNKKTMVMRGGKTSESINNALKDLYSLKKPEAVMLSKKNDARPFEDETHLEKMSKKLDASLFLYGSHTKKRPNNLVIGRMFNHQVLDMFELGADNYQSLASFANSKTSMGSKPCLIFNGADWDSTAEYQRLKNLFVDFFRGPAIEKIRLMGLEQALTFTLSEGKIYARNYKILLKKSGLRTPRVELEEIGPSFDFVIRRHKLASDHMYKDALKIPRTIKPKKKKNISHDVFGSKLGRVHMQKQDVKKMQIRKMKGLKATREEKKAKLKALKAAGE
ncbi:ribosome production factor 2 homolog [Watersipora subatra]|uniref:ribosome production factor 2 homolog n=1 Tax=Watersipora subatra TaxID=2589382 RepID=UPI00355BBA9F